MLPWHAPTPNPVNAVSLRQNNLHSTVITLTDWGVWGRRSNHRKTAANPGDRAQGWREAADTRRGVRDDFFFCAFKSYLEKADMRFEAPYCCGCAPSSYQLWEKNTEAGIQTDWDTHNINTHSYCCIVQQELSFTTYSLDLFWRESEIWLHLNLAGMDSTIKSDFFPLCNLAL